MCNKSHDHDQAAGSETAKTVYYPPLMCDKIHDAFRAHVAYLNSDLSRNEIMFKYLDHSRVDGKGDSIETLDAWLYAEDESVQRAVDASSQGGGQDLVDTEFLLNHRWLNMRSRPRSSPLLSFGFRRLGIKVRVHEGAWSLLL